MELSNQVEPVPNAIFIGTEPTVDIRKVSNHSSSSSYSDYSKSQTKYIIGPPSTSSRKSRRQASPKIQRSQKPPRSPKSPGTPKSPRRKLRTKSLSKKFRRSIGQELETFLERESASDDLQVIISQMVQDMNEKDKTIRLLQDALAKTNLAVIRLQENMKEVQAQLKGNRMESEEVPAMIPPSVENSPVASDQKESIDAERITELSAQLKNLQFNNKSDRKKRRKRSSREKTGKASKRSKRKARQNAKAEQNLDPAVLKTVFQKRVKKLIAAHNFFTATALKIYEARRDVDKKSFAESTYKLDDAISKHQIVENLEDIMSRRHQQQSSPRRSSFMSTGSEEDVPQTKQLRWKDDENLHEVHLVEPMCDKYTRDEFFYTADEIKLFRFDKFMEDNAQEFDFEIIDSDEESWDEEIIEEEDEELDEDASLVSHASQVTL